MKNPMLLIPTQLLINDEPVGFRMFKINVDDDLFHLDQNNSVKAIKKLLLNQSSEGKVYYYLNHELLYNEIIVLDDESFVSAINEN